MFKKIFDFIIPHNLRNDVVAYSYAKNLIVVGIVALITAPFFYFLYVLLGFYKLAPLILIEGMIIVASVISLKFIKSLTFSREIIVASTTILFALISIHLGGLISPSSYWLILPPVIAVILGGMRTAFILCIINQILLFNIYLFSRPLSMAHLSSNNLMLLYMMSVIGLSCVVLVIVWNSEKIKVEGLLLKYRAYHDPLTGLINRFTFEDRLNLSIIKYPQRHFLIASINIDNFKNINDVFGNLMGDVLLKQVAKRISSFIKNKNIVARMSGDEFNVIIYDDRIISNILLNKILSKLKEVHVLNFNHEVFVSASIGVALYPQDATDPSTLLHYADLALQKAKENNGNNIRYFAKQFADQDQYSLVVQHNLALALKNNEFSLFYQPKFLTQDTSKIVGMEVLLRWNHPEMGYIPPSTFIPIAEKTGHIAEIGDWVLNNSLKYFTSWKNQNILPRNITIAVNLSVHQLKRENAYEIIEGIIHSAGMDPTLLEIEITESAFMVDQAHIINVLKKLKLLGIIITIDDFGTGYSSLSYLSEIPLDIIKIDKKFIDKFKEDSNMVTTIINMAHHRRLKVVAEGVELLEQLEFLKIHQCDYVQGFYLSKPLPKNEMKLLFKQTNMLLPIT